MEARRNPGLGGAGAHIFFGLGLVVELWWGSMFRGEEVTNKVAEYEGLILGLQAAVQIFGRKQFHFQI